MISGHIGPGKGRAVAAVPKAAAKSAEDRPVIVEGRGIGVSFKGVRALNNVDIQVRAGEVFGLLGPNGAGKSTLLGVLSSLLRPDSGEVYVAGVRVTREAPHRRAARGLARTFQHPQLFADLTVRQHLRLAYRLHHERRRLWSDLVDGAGLRPPSSEETRVVGELLELLQLQEIADHPVVGLPLGTGRLVEVAQAFATRPKVVLLDEPSSGLDPQETKRLVTALSDVVAAHGVSLLLVEHDIEMVMGISDTIQVLESGQTIAVGPPARIRANAAVKSAYLGDQLDAPDEAKPRARVVGGTAGGRRAEEPPARPILRADQLCAAYGHALVLDNISLEVMPGSVLALLGANGAGKSTLGRVLSGLMPAASGSIHFDGVDVTALPAHEIRQRGLVYLPEGRGVFPSLSVADNLKLAVRTLPKPEREAAVGAAMAMFPIFGQRRRQLAGQLSGGEQQMLSLARALTVGPRLVIADEMSLGLAPKIVDQVFDALRVAIDSGITVIIIEQLVHQALNMADHCCILRRGQVAWSGAAAAVDGILDHYLGSAPEHEATHEEVVDAIKAAGA
jgi:branched-chain amino acid transport system ATP-binding protein